MKKETQVHATVEIIDILPNFTFTGGTIEEVREQAKAALKAKFEPLAVDHFNITDVKVIEIENRINTEELAEFANRCASVGCYKCPFYWEADAKNDCRGKLILTLADRLEELLKATQEVEHHCFNCKYKNLDYFEEPCAYCKHYIHSNSDKDMWEGE